MVPDMVPLLHIVGWTSYYKVRHAFNGANSHRPIHCFLFKWFIIKWCMNTSWNLLSMLPSFASLFLFLESTPLYLSIHLWISWFLHSLVFLKAIMCFLQTQNGLPGICLPTSSRCTFQNVVLTSCRQLSISGVIYAVWVHLGSCQVC